jgi:hypothetical protein
MPDENDSVMRNLGRFVGAIWHGIKTDPSRREVRRTVEEREDERDGQRVIVRRTTIDEVEFKKPNRGD